MNRAALRVSGSALSWVLFVFIFTLLLLSAATIVGLGGNCATGGPFEIRAECPDTVTWVAPLSLPVAFLALGIGAYVAKGFGTPLTTWAWPVTFLGYGIAFLVAAFVAGIGWGFVVCGALFVVVGAIAPVVFLRADPRRAVVGSVDLRGRRFAASPRARKVFWRNVDPAPAGTLVPTAADVARSLLIALSSSAVGVLLAILVFWAATRT